MAIPRTPTEPRFLKSIGNTSCWLWKGYINKTTGYGTINSYENVQTLAHRFSYEFFIGEIPKDLQIDHLCRNRACVNPLHLEPVTSRVNGLRGTSPAAVNAKKTSCKSGHEFNEKNTYYRTGNNAIPTRMCRTCINRVSKETKLRNPAKYKKV